jgi:predicted dehydrogenase
MRVYFFDFCSSGCGVWSRSWHGTRAAARGARRELIASGRYDPRGEGCGERGDITPVVSDYIELTRDGVIRALNNSDPNE